MHPQLDQGAFVWTTAARRHRAGPGESRQGWRWRDLVCRADVLVENFSPGVMRRLGLDHETSSGTRGLVTARWPPTAAKAPSPTASGWRSHRAGRKRLRFMNGYPDREGVRALAGDGHQHRQQWWATPCSARCWPERLGRGRRVEVSLFDTAVLMTGYATMQSLFTGKEPQRSGNRPDTCPRAPSRASDLSYINSGNDRIFQRLWGGAGTSDVRRWPDYATGPLRIRHRERLFAFLDEAFARHDWAHWQVAWRAAGVPHGLVRTVGGRSARRATRPRTRRRIPIRCSAPNVRLLIRYAATPMADPVAAPGSGAAYAGGPRDEGPGRTAGPPELERAGAFGPARPPAAGGGIRRACA